MCKGAYLCYLCGGCTRTGLICTPSQMDPQERKPIGHRTPLVATNNDQSDYILPLPLLGSPT